MSTVAPEQTGFELDRFQWADDDRLEVEGRWFGVRGRRFVRPVLTVQVAGGRRRLLAVLEHKPWNADEGAAWIAAFPWDGPRDDVGDGELEVGALTVDLPPPGASKSPRKRRRAESTPPTATAAPAPKVVSPPEPTGGEPVLRAAGESRQQLERDLASARAELGRIRARHEDELRSARSEARKATERLSALEAQAGESGRRAELLEDEATRLREELEAVRESQGEQLTRMGASEAEARAELARERERAEEVGGEADRLRATAADVDRLQDERDGIIQALEDLREKHEEALAEVAKLRQAARRSAAEVERLRAASRRPGARLSAAAPDATHEGDAATPKRVPAPSKPGPAVRVIPRERPAPPREEAPPQDAAPPETREEAPPGPRDELPAPPYRVAEPEVPTAAEAAAEAPPRPSPSGEETQAFDVLAEMEAAPEPKPPVAARAQVPTARPEPGAGAARLLGEDAIVPLEHRGALEVWGPRVVAVVLVVLLLIAAALIVRGLA
jgi:hypothetical protein